MITGPAVMAFLDYLNPKLKGFGVLPQNVYCPELDFRKAVLEHMSIFENVTQNHITPLLDKLGFRKSKWAVLAWSRQGLQDQSVINLRTFKTRFQRVSDIGSESQMEVVRTKLVDMPLDVVIFSNSLATAESLEEYLRMLLHDHIKTEFHFPVLDEPLPLFIQRADDIRFEKLPSSEFGAVTIVGISVRLTFPIFMDLGVYPLIMDILTRMYVPMQEHLYDVYESKADQAGNITRTVVRGVQE